MKRVNWLIPEAAGVDVWSNGMNRTQVSGHEESMANRRPSGCQLFYLLFVAMNK